jgi:hypothetical protein
VNWALPEGIFQFYMNQLAERDLSPEAFAKARDELLG